MSMTHTCVQTENTYYINSLYNKMFRSVRRVCCYTPASYMVREVYHSGHMGGRVRGCPPPHSLSSKSRAPRSCSEVPEEHMGCMSMLSLAPSLFARVEQPCLYMSFLRLVEYSCQQVARQLALSALPQNASWQAHLGP